MKSGKRAILQEMLNLQYLMLPVSDAFPAVVPTSIPSKIINQSKDMRFDFLFKHIIPLFQNSTIPTESESELTCTSGGGYSASVCALLLKGEITDNE